VIAWLGVTSVDVKSKIPACYSKELDDCITAFEQKKTTYPNPLCAGMYPTWKLANDNAEWRAAWEAAIHEIPYCSGPAVEEKRDFPIAPFLAVLGIAGVLAVIVNASGARF
jgi:hypothetical protein